MATSKAYRTKASGSRAKHYQPARVATAVLGNGWFQGIATAVPYNPRVRQLMPKSTGFQPAKVIVLKVNSSLDKTAAEPLNNKAVEARNMFAKYRKNH